MMELEKGKLYQVKTWKGDWIIAEFICKSDAHMATYMNVSSDFRHIGKAKQKLEPDTWHWQPLSGEMRFAVTDLQVRPVTDEALAEIARLKALIEQKQQEVAAARRELRELCS